MIKLIFVLIVVIFSLTITVYALIKTVRKYKADCKELEKQNQKRIDNLKNLASYIKELTAIKNNESKIETKINEAVSDEEVNQIIGDIVSSNNDRVQKSTEE